MRHLGLGATLAVLAVIIAAVPTAAEARREGWETLRRQRDVTVLIRELPSEASALGLAGDRLKTAVEERLREVGIKVPARLGSYVVVTLTTLHVPEANSYAAHVYVEFKQLVFLEPWPSAPGQYLGTWHTGRLQLVPASDYPQGVEQVLAKCMDDFISDWQAANGRY